MAPITATTLCNKSQRCAAFLMSLSAQHAFALISQLLQRFWFKIIVALCIPSSVVPVFYSLNCLQNKTFRDVQRQACQLPLLWVVIRIRTVQPAGRFIPRMLKLMLKQTTWFLVRQLKRIRKWLIMSCHYFLINHRLLQSTCWKMGDPLCWHYP